MMIKKIQVNKSLIVKIFIDLSSIYFIETESDEVKHKSLPKTDSASQNSMKKTFLILNSYNVCILPTAKPAKRADISFFCKVYYEEKAMLEWEVMFTVVKNLNALQRVITSYCI